jgi:L-2,4-diaminobutyric acid acetyltransferase
MFFVNTILTQLMRVKIDWTVGGPVSDLSTHTTIEFAVPVPEDGAALAALIQRCEPLEPNTTYAYVLFCTHFADTCVLARDDAGLLGAIVGYCPPNKPDAVFVWQIAVDARGRGQGLGTRMLHALTQRLQPRGVRYLEATVAPSNTASDQLFRRYAEKNDFPLERTPYFTAELFGAEAAHEEEFLYRIALNEATTNQERTN